MKNIITTALVLISLSVQSQIAIGKQAVTNTSVSLEFADTENRGLILPYVEDKSGITENGTVIYDITDYKVKYLKDTNTWQDLSIDGSGTANISIQTGKTESAPAKAAIGLTPETDTAAGVLVLSDTDKAMILPKVASPHLSIITPSPGMIVYDTVKRQLAVFNGTVWSFWKP